MSVPVSSSVILFDSECVFCSRSVQFIIRRDRKGHFKFAPLNGRFASGIEGVKEAASLILKTEQKVYRQSEAVLRIAIGLGGGYRLLSLFLIIPAFMRDAVYRFVARHRYRIIGRSENCLVVDPAIADRFLP